MYLPDEWEAIIIGKTYSSIDYQKLRIGWWDSYARDPPDNGTYFEYVSDTDTTWQAVTRKGGSETKTDTGVNVSADTWYKFKILRDAEGVKFYIDDALEATHTTNISTAAMYIGAILWPTSSDYRYFYLDLFYVKLKGLSR